MRWGLLLRSGAALAVALLSFATDAVALAPASPPEFPAVVARVDGLEVAGAELVTRANLRRAEALAAGSGDPAGEAGFYRETLDTLVAEKLLFLDARKRGALVAPAEIDAAIAAMRSGFPDQAALEASLAKQGTSIAGVRAQLVESLTLEKVIREEIAPGVQVDAAAVRELYERVKGRYPSPARYHARQLLFRLPAAASAEERAALRRKATGYVVELRGGADFARLAREVSDDERTREQGGDLGWIVPTGGVASSFDEALSRLQPGQVSDVVETGAGLHVLQLIELRPAGPRPFEELRADLERHLRRRETARAVAARAASLRAAATIEILI